MTSVMSSTPVSGTRAARPRTPDVVIDVGPAPVACLRNAGEDADDVSPPPAPGPGAIRKLFVPRIAIGLLPGQNGCAILDVRYDHPPTCSTGSVVSHARSPARRRAARLQRLHRRPAGAR